jgi:hypothetical protein
MQYWFGLTSEALKANYPPAVAMTSRFALRIYRTIGRLVMAKLALL